MSTSPLKLITPPGAPTPVGPYSPAVVVGNLVFVSGQAGRDPATNTVAPDVEAQTEQTLRNIETILEGRRLEPVAGGAVRGVSRGHQGVPEDERGVRPDVRRPPAGADDG